MHLLSACCIQHAVPGARLKTVPWAGMRMSPDLASEECQAQRFPDHPRSLTRSKRADVGCHRGRAPVSPLTLPAHLPALPPQGPRDTCLKTCRRSLCARHSAKSGNQTHLMQIWQITKFLGFREEHKHWKRCKMSFIGLDLLSSSALPAPFTGEEGG